MSALLPKADMCAATTDVGYGPERLTCERVDPDRECKNRKNLDDEAGSWNTYSNSRVDLFDDKRRHVWCGPHFCADGPRAERGRRLLDFGGRCREPDFGGAVRMGGRSAAPRPLLATETFGNAFKAG